MLFLDRIMDAYVCNCDKRAPHPTDPLCVIPPSKSRFTYHNDQPGRRVEGPGDGDALPLAAGQLNSPLANLGQIAVRHQLDVRSEGARTEHPVVPARPQRLPEQDVVPDGGV